MTCHACHEPVQGPVCAGCGALQAPPAEPDPFRLLGLPRKFHIEPSSVDRAWRDVSRKVHPDRWVGKNAVSRRMSLQWTSALNEARRILRDPLTRARWLATARAAAREEGGPELDAAFLEEVFELRTDATDDPARVRARAGALREGLAAELEAIFTRWESGEAPLDGPRVEDLLARMRYMDQLIEAA